jgi:hypothetical protein
MRTAPLATALLLGVACGEAPPSLVRVVQLEADGSHRLADVQLTTSPELEHLWSDAIRLRGGGRVVLDGLRFQRAADEELGVAEVRRLTRDDLGRRVDFRYRRVDDVAVPDDYESLLMVSAYHGFERVRDFFWAREVSLATRSTIEICFGCGLYVDVGLPLPYIVSDNAAYVAFADLFVMVPELLLGDMPIAADAGILCHEFSHRVFRYAVYPDAVFEQLVDAFAHQTALTPEAWRTLNLLKAVDEGSADFFAAAFSGNPRFAAASLGLLGEADRRDLEGTRASDEAYSDVFAEAAAENHDVVTDADGGHAVGRGDWNPYHLGTIWAGALWRLGDVEGSGEVEVERVRDEVVPALLVALRRVGIALGERFDFGLDLILAELVAALPAERQQDACASLAGSFPGPLALAEPCR